MAGLGRHIVRSELKARDASDAREVAAVGEARRQEDETAQVRLSEGGLEHV